VSDPDELEIERKYLLKSMPVLPERAGRRTLTIDQGYIPGDRIKERLRQVSENGRERWYRTVKLGRGLARQEFEDETSGEIFLAMWPLTLGKRLRKRRHVIPESGLNWEIDEFLDRPLVLAEVELPAIDTVVTVPEWLAAVLDREVTGELPYLNSTLAR
jgi:CYTH domain-containing protein